MGADSVALAAFFPDPDPNPMTNHGPPPPPTAMPCRNRRRRPRAPTERLPNAVEIQERRNEETAAKPIKNSVKTQSEKGKTR